MEGSVVDEEDADIDIVYEEGVPEAAASRMEVEIMEPEEKLGPSLGRVLGWMNYSNVNIKKNILQALEQLYSLFSISLGCLSSFTRYTEESILRRNLFSWSTNKEVLRKSYQIDIGIRKGLRINIIVTGVFFFVG